MALHHIGHRDGAVGLGLLSTDDLAVPEDQKNSAREGTAAFVHFLQLDFYLAGIFKNEGHIMFPVPHEGLLDLGHIGAEDEPLGRGDLLREVRPGGQLGEVQILFEDIPAVLGSVLSEEAAAIVQLDAGNADDSAGDAHSGVVTVYLADGTVALFFIGLVVEHERVGDGVIGHYRYGLGCGLGYVTLRHSLLRDGVLAGFQVVRFLRQRECSIGASSFGCGETSGTIRALHFECHPREWFVGARFQLFHGKLNGIFFLTFLRHGNQQTLHGHAGLTEQHPSLGLVPFILPYVIFMIIFRMIQHQVYAGFNIVVGGVAGFAAIGAIDDRMGVYGVPILDPRGLAVGAVVQLHGCHKFLGGLLDEALPIGSDINDDAVLVVPAHCLCYHEPYVGPVAAPGFKAAGIAGVSKVAVGVGVHIGEQGLQRGICHLGFEVPLLPICPGAKGAFLVGTQCPDGGVQAGNSHLFVKDVG